MKEVKIIKKSPSLLKESPSKISFTLFLKEIPEGDEGGKATLLITYTYLNVKLIEVVDRRNLYTKTS